MTPTYTIDNASIIFAGRRPDAEALADLAPGDFAKLSLRRTSMNRRSPYQTERPWFEITARDGDTFTGKLFNDLAVIDGLSFGDIVEFKVDHIVDAMTAAENAALEAEIDAHFASLSDEEAAA